MSKNHNKDVREPINEQESVNKLSDAEKLRLATGRQGKLDASHYLRLPEYKEMTFRWCHLNKGEVEHARDLGMRFTPVRKDRMRHERQFRDERYNDYEHKSVGIIDGEQEYAFLMHIPNDEYKKFFVQPNIDRNAEIDKAMGLGIVDDDAKSAGGGLQTYAGKIGDGNYNKVR